MTVPLFFNIGVACTDAHLGTPAAERIAMIVAGAERGTSQVTFAELAELTSRFAQVLRELAVINSFGYRVSPFEVERVLKDHPAVADCAVTGEEVGPDKTIIAVFLLLAPGKVASAEEIITYAGQHLASYKCPRAVHFVEDLPRTANGKILRRALRK